MQLLLPNSVSRKLKSHLRRAGRREIGGMLMAEEVGNQIFRLAEFSVDAESGSATRFLRHAEVHDQNLSEFFDKTGTDYQRFNYLGEWHSHPSFSVQPSLQDLRAMQDLVDGSGGVDFAVLLIVRLRWYWKFDCSAHLFVNGYHPSVVDVIHAT